jgi:UDP-N-acetylglucosamine diphosphorylase / glucose-1-phosphate thymidylyltransferase / UDP-N-acetylgalactosamine diphosphorylase / glucosamine-1-phosphate N-acetyltransferase / galactosamine-1-phosphate N-acetyltransferase
MQICIFEGIYYDRLEPLIYSRPTYDLICGINSLRKKILRAYPEVKYSLHCRPYLEHFVRIKNPGTDINKIEDDHCLLINGRIIASHNLSEIIPLEGEDRLYTNGDTIIAARVSGKNLEEIKKNLYDLLSESNFEGLPVEKVDVPVVDYVWDLIANNPKELVNDYEQLLVEHRIKKNGNVLGKVYDGAYMVEKENIFIEEGAVIKPGAVLDGSNGPIYIDKNSTVASNAVVEGAVYLGENSQIKSCARIYDNVSIGQTCKVGGEVEDSIILPFTNKQHSGFLGHAYLGSWVNIGADTNCSDLKNNYGNVKVYTNGEIVDSNLQFLGVIMGDHTKTAINTMFNTGTIVGFSCNIFGAGFPDKYIPSFSWGGSDAVTTYDLERSIETAKRMLQRRTKAMSDPEERLFRKIFDITKKERRKRGYPY